MIVPTGSGKHGGDHAQAADDAEIINDAMGRVSDAGHYDREERQAGQQQG
ncbi:hypothetical protein ONR75_15920 [Rhodopseudomonas sp. P2A-2r]|nr:hypothetical protein [Rhodopseudomonas sp. P2A-2r]UZE51918.1 hypothetical protein ONR75_15920 [Rhodopseudomonas sp. P2A-2r]